ncbi:peptidoglycan DD-metalloendopeptidase family protein [Phenylobacterium sp. SCN 70-31]|uniref:M23 family metallopeptidase n=1 Tax=Phenylobacterium sp. SCN 70-31 TaxID=1660129 RepID=UPI0025E1AC62|nr:peptidoglycan DD-metalloendopeptidase family protein [Phenylobacterium sp. SCN 70-31]
MAVIAAIGLGLAGGAALGGRAGAVTAPVSIPQPSAAPASATPAGVDLDEDGRDDLAWPLTLGQRGEDAYGSGAFGASRDGGRRRHNGLDLVAPPGAPIRAPMSGVVTRVGQAYSGDPELQFVEITSPTTRYSARVLYVGPSRAPGAQVTAGEIIGRAQDLGRRYASGMTNHVHVEFSDRRGAVLDPLAVLPAVPRRSKA